MGRFSGTANINTQGGGAAFFEVDNTFLVSAKKLFVTDSAKSRGQEYLCFEGEVVDSTLEAAIGRRRCIVVSSKHGDVYIAVAKSIAIALGADPEKLEGPSSDSYMDKLFDNGADSISEDLEDLLINVRTFRKEGKVYTSHAFSPATDEDYEVLEALSA